MPSPSRRKSERWRQLPGRRANSWPRLSGGLGGSLGLDGRRGAALGMKAWIELVLTRAEVGRSRGVRDGDSAAALDENPDLFISDVS